MNKESEYLRIICPSCGVCIADEHGTSSPQIARAWKEIHQLRQQLAALQQLNQRVLRAIGDGEMQVFCDHDEDNDIFEEIEKLVGYPSPRHEPRGSR